MRTYKFRILIEQDEDGAYVVSCPALQGCYSQGNSIFHRSDGRWTTVPIHKGKDIAKGLFIRY